MLKRRIIPCLDIKNGRVVKGVHFGGLRDAGDPVEAARAYDQQGADEVCLLDITATTEGRETFLEIVERVAAQIFCPLTVGGGIRREEDVRRLLNAGADKVAINSAAVSNPPLIDRLTNKYGSQCIVGAVDVRRLPSPGTDAADGDEPEPSGAQPPSDGLGAGLAPPAPPPVAPHSTGTSVPSTGSATTSPGLATTPSPSTPPSPPSSPTMPGESAAHASPAPQTSAAATPEPVETLGVAGSRSPEAEEPFPVYEVVIHAGTRSTGLDAIHWCKQLAELGAGELLITSMDRDGTRDGYDLFITREIARAVPIPVIASGGVGSLGHLREGLAIGEGEADAALAASIFHFGLFTIAQAKHYLAEHGIPVRPAEEALPTVVGS